MENSKQLSHQATDSDITPIKFWGNIVLAALGILVNIFLLRSAFQLPETTISYVAKAFHSLVILAGSLVILLTIRGHQKLGAQVVFYLVVVLFASGSFLYAESALTALFSFTTISAVIISQLLPKELRRRSIFITAVVWTIIGLAAWINPSWRLPARTVGGAGLSASILFATVLVAIIIRQTWGGSIRVKFITSFMGITLLSVAIVALVNYYNSRSSLTASSGTAIKSVADSKAVAISDTLLQETHILQSFSLSKILQDQAVQVNAAYGPNQTDNINNTQELDKQWRAADAVDNNNDPLVSAVLNNDVSSELREYRETFLENVEVFVTDKYGAVFASTNRTSDYYQADEEWWQTAYNNGQGAFYLGQPEFDQSSKTFALIMAIPLYAHGTHEIQGVLRTTIQMDSILSILNQDILNGTGYAKLYLPDGLMIDPKNANGTHPADTNALDRLPALTSNKSFDTFTLEGVPSVVSAARITSEDTQMKQALKNLDWSLVVSQSQADNLAPVNAQQQYTTIVALIILALSALIAVFFAQLLSNPIVRLTSVAEQIAAGNTAVQAKVESTDEIGKLASTFNSMTSQLRDLIGSLEQRVATRTRNLELAAEVGRAVSQVNALDVMLTDAAELIRKQFDLYYVQVYLTNPSRTALLLKAGTGNAGEQLLARSHQLPLNANSINGRAAVEKRAVVISETAASVSFHANPLLPDTQSEMAVPLIIGEKVVGVLDMQSAKAGALSEENLVAFEALAAQLAVAIQNANLLAETVQARAELEAQAKRLSRTNWADYLDAIHKPEEIGVVFQQDKVMPLTEELEPKEDALVVPISVLGENLGNLVVELDGQSPIADTKELVDTVARQVSLQLEELRLLDSAERYRLEAEEAVRRTTIEGWKNFIESRPEKIAGYMYDSNEVKALPEEPENSALTMPILVRDEAIGKFSLQEMEAQDDQSLDIAKAVVERLGAHIDNLRLYDQSRSALMHSEKLFEASSQLTQASNLQEVVATTVEKLNIPVVNRALLTTFQYGPSGDIEQLTIIGNWWNGSGHEPTPIGTRYPREIMRAMSMFVSPVPVFFNDTLDDERIDSSTMGIVQRLNLRSVAILPLHSSNKQIGALALEGEEPHKFSQQEIRLFSSLAPQIATILENRQQYEQAQRQAEREAMLNTISQKIQSATSVESVLQIAARELGSALDASRAVAQLGMKLKIRDNGNGHHS
jgi:GAF domain-containing protein/HAMP domain-containing protein